MYIVCRAEDIKIKIKIGPEFASESTTEIFGEIQNKNSKNQPSTFIGVGTSDCDQSRSDRTNDINGLWDKIHVKEFINGLFRPSLLFIREALSCYQNGAFLGATIMCRSTVDSLLYTSVYSSFKSEDCSIEYNFSEKQTKFHSLVDCAYKMGYLKENHFKWLKAELDQKDPEVGIIRYSGDLVAHYTEKIIKRQTKLHSGQSDNSSLWQESEWISKGTSYDILDKTIEILVYVNKKYKESKGIY